MLKQLRASFAAHLGAGGEGVLCAGGLAGLAALPVRYRAEGLAVDLLLPRWAEAAFQLERAGDAVLVVPLASPAAGRWLVCRGPVERAPSPDWRALDLERRPFVELEELYLVARMLPRRIDLLDAARAWGILETFEDAGREEFKPQETRRAQEVL